MDTGGFSRYTFEDLLRIKDVLTKRERDLMAEIEQIRFQLKNVDSALALNKHRDETLGVFFPTNFFEIRQKKELLSGSTKRVNWKSIATSIIKSHNGLMTTQMIYENARIIYPSDLNNRIYSIRNFSSALHYLCSEGKLLRFKEDSVREYAYGLKEYFDLFGNEPKEEFMNKYLTEKQRRGK